MRPVLPLLVLALGACTPPPPAPEGLDEASAFMVREFWADDATFGAGVQGFMEWFETDGIDLVGLRPTVEEGQSNSTDAFTVGELSADDVSRLPLSEMVLVDPKNDESIPRDVTLAKGVVSLAEMDCDWIETEDYLRRPDQDTIFPRDWEGYTRDYATDPEVYAAASRSGDFTPIRDVLDPFDPSFDPEAYADVLMFTENMADPTNVLVANLPEYPLDLHFRHGIFDLDGVPTGMFAIITFNAEAVWGPQGNNALLQSFSIELNVQRPNDKTLRMLAVWAEPRGGGIDADSALALNFAVNKSLTSSELLSDICAGTVEVD